MLLVCCLQELQKPEETNQVIEQKFCKVLNHVWKDFKRSYSDPYVRKLCFWWAIAFGAYVQVLHKNISQYSFIFIYR